MDVVLSVLASPSSSIPLSQVFLVDVVLRVLATRPSDLFHEGNTCFLIVMLALGIAEVVMEGIGGVYAVQ